MENEIKLGDLVKDVCGDIGEVIDIEYTDNGEVWRYILNSFEEEKRYTWPAHPDYTYKISIDK